MTATIQWLPDCKRWRGVVCDEFGHVVTVVEAPRKRMVKQWMRITGAMGTVRKMPETVSAAHGLDE